MQKESLESPICLRLHRATDGEPRHSTLPGTPLSSHPHRMLVLWLLLEDLTPKHRPNTAVSALVASRRTERPPPAHVSAL